MVFRKTLWFWPQTNRRINKKASNKKYSDRQPVEGISLTTTVNNTVRGMQESTWYNCYTKYLVWWTDTFLNGHKWITTIISVLGSRSKQIRRYPICVPPRCVTRITGHGWMTRMARSENWSRVYSSLASYNVGTVRAFHSRGLTVCCTVDIIMLKRVYW